MEEEEEVKEMRSETTREAEAEVEGLWPFFFVFLRYCWCQTFYLAGGQ